MKARNSGFTLIELVIVIVILGILSAIVVPKFVDLGKDARVSTLNGMAAALRSAATMAHAAQLTQQLSANQPIDTDGDGATDTTMINGYPRAIAAGIVAVIEDMTGFTTAGGGNGANSTIQFRKDGAPTTATCRVDYQAANPGAGRNTPAVSIVDTGC